MQMRPPVPSRIGSSTKELGDRWKVAVRGTGVELDGDEMTRIIPKGSSPWK